MIKNAFLGIVISALLFSRIVYGIESPSELKIAEIPFHNILFMY